MSPSTSYNNIYDMANGASSSSSSSSSTPNHKSPQLQPQYSHMSSSHNTITVDNNEDTVHVSPFSGVSSHRNNNTIDQFQLHAMNTVLKASNTATAAAVSAAVTPTVANANPGPFGLCAFALTAFTMGLYNLKAGGVANSMPSNVMTGTALFYGGLGQVIAGLLEFRNGNTFGATTFCSYGMYWISYASLLIPSFGVSAAFVDASLQDYETAVGFYLLGWTVFTFLMWTLTFRSNIASVLLFFCLGITYLLSTVSTLGHLGSGNLVGKLSGATGIVTSFVAWYCAMADLATKENSFYTLPMGQLGRR